MSIFSDKQSLETRLATAEADLAAAMVQVSALTAERDQANQCASGLERLLGEANAARTSAEQNLSALTSQLSTSLHLTDEQLAAIAARNTAIIPAAIEEISGQKAIELAAGQGCAPVPTSPAQHGTVEEEIRFAFEAAAAEPNPTIRAGMYARAAALISKN